MAFICMLVDCDMNISGHLDPYAVVYHTVQRLAVTCRGALNQEPVALCETERESKPFSRSSYTLVTGPGFPEKWMGCLSSRSALRKADYFRKTEQPPEREISNSHRP